MKQAFTIRIDPALLAGARECAVREHRTLTNLIEAALRDRIIQATENDERSRPLSPRKKASLSRNV